MNKQLQSELINKMRQAVELDKTNRKNWELGYGE